MSVATSLTPMEQIVVDDVRERGYHLMPIFDDEGPAPNYMHSIGFWRSVSQPEVVVFGLRDELMAVMLGELHQKCRDGLNLIDGLRIPGLIEGFDCIVRLISDTDLVSAYFGWAVWYRAYEQQAPMSQAFQIVWPGAQQGRFPWEAGCDQYVIDYQPALYGEAPIS